MLLDDVRSNVAVIIDEDEDLASSDRGRGIARSRAARGGLMHQAHWERRAASEFADQFGRVVRRAVVHDDELPRPIAANQVDMVKTAR